MGSLFILRFFVSSKIINLSAAPNQTAVLILSSLSFFVHFYLLDFWPFFSPLYSIVLLFFYLHQNVQTLWQMSPAVLFPP
jgi:hypothetical protein